MCGGCCSTSVIYCTFAKAFLIKSLMVATKDRKRNDAVSALQASSRSAAVPQYEKRLKAHVDRYKYQYFALLFANRPFFRLLVAICTQHLWMILSQNA